jgi:hypothetical protein
VSLLTIRVGACGQAICLSRQSAARIAWSGGSASRTATACCLRARHSPTRPVPDHHRVRPPSRPDAYAAVAFACWAALVAGGHSQHAVVRPDDSAADQQFEDVLEHLIDCARLDSDRIEWLSRVA